MGSHGSATSRVGLLPVKVLAAMHQCPTKESLGSSVSSRVIDAERESLRMDIWIEDLGPRPGRRDDVGPRGSRPGHGKAGREPDRGERACQFPDSSHVAAPDTQFPGDRDFPAR